MRQPGCFYGDVVRIERIGELILTDVRTPAGLVVPDHTHERAYLELVLEGRWSEMCGSDVRDLAPWAVLYHPPGERHSDSFGATAARSIHIELSEGWLARLGAGQFDTTAPAHSRSPDVATPMVRLARELGHLDRWSAMTVEGLVLETAALLAKDQERRNDCRPPSWLGRLESLLRESYVSADSLSGAVRSVGADPSVVSRVFRRHFGCTPSEFVRRLRVERAAQALTGTEDPLSTIAVQSGFSDQSHLTRVFRRYTGSTPGAYRKREVGRSEPALAGGPWPMASG